MLALMPPATIPDLHNTSPSSNANNMSLAVLPPSALPTPPSCVYSMSGLTPAQTAHTKRPKLSLNTSSLPTAYSSKSTTALRIETLSVASPTSMNTYNNAYGHVATPTSVDSHTPKPQLFIEPLRRTTHRSHAPTPLRTSSTDSIISSTSSTSDTSAVSALSSASSVSSTSSTSFPLPPYRLPFNHKSILTNGPVPRLKRKKSFTTTRPMFPSTKRVSFRAPLTEEIETEKYTLAHFDLDSSSTISTLNMSHPQRDTVHPSKPAEASNSNQERNGADVESSREAQPAPKSPHAGDKRESSDEEEEDSDVCPATPVTRHSKRQREWKWTLPATMHPFPPYQDGTETNSFAAG